MAIKTLKFKTSDFPGKDISSLPDVPGSAGYSAQQIKERFDMVGKVLVAMGALNKLIDALVNGGAGEIGAAVEGLQGKNVQALLNEIYAYAKAHAENRRNPHGVTKAQVGLGNCDNTSDTNKPVSTAQAAAINAVKKLANDHAARVDNPHRVDKVDVGLGNCDNTSDADKPVSAAQAAAIAAAEARAREEARRAQQAADMAAAVADRAAQQAGAVYGMAEKALGIAGEAKETARQAEEKIDGVYFLHNPVTGSRDPIQQVIDDLFNAAARSNALTADQYAALALTADRYATARITAYNYATRGALILGGVA